MNIIYLILVVVVTSLILTPLFIWADRNLDELRPSSLIFIGYILACISIGLFLVLRSM